MAKATGVKFLEVRATSTSVTATFGNGKSVTLFVERLPEGIAHNAMLLGLTNKVRDTAANFSKTLDYVGAAEAMDSTIQALYDGEWNRNGGGVAGQKMKDLAQALAEIAGASYEKALAKVEAADNDTRLGWSKNPKVAAAIARIVQQRLEAAANVSSVEDDLPSFDMDGDE